MYINLRVSRVVHEVIRIGVIHEVGGGSVIVPEEAGRGGYRECDDRDEEECTQTQRQPESVLGETQTQEGLVSSTTELHVYIHVVLTSREPHNLPVRPPPHSTLRGAVQCRPPTAVDSDQ